MILSVLLGKRGFIVFAMRRKIRLVTGG